LTQLAALLQAGGARFRGVESDWRALVTRDDIDVIDVCMPQSLHATIAIAAAEAGKHVLCEKPLASSTSDHCRAPGRQPSRQAQERILQPVEE